MKEFVWKVMHIVSKASEFCPLTNFELELWNVKFQNHLNYEISTSYFLSNFYIKPLIIFSTTSHLVNFLFFSRESSHSGIIRWFGCIQWIWVTKYPQEQCFSFSNFHQNSLTLKSLIYDMWFLLPSIDASGSVPNMYQLLILQLHL